MTMRQAAGLICLLVLWVSSWVPPVAWGQASSSVERTIIMLPADPAQWEHILNEWGQKGWEAQSVQQPAAGGLFLHLVTLVRLPGNRPVSHAVVLAEFPNKADATTLDQTRSRLELQTNQYSQSGWQLLHVATGRLIHGEHFVALIFKKP